MLHYFTSIKSLPYGKKTRGNKIYMSFVLNFFLAFFFPWHNGNFMAFGINLLIRILYVTMSSMLLCYYVHICVSRNSQISLLWTNKCLENKMAWYNKLFLHLQTINWRKMRNISQSKDMFLFDCTYFGMYKWWKITFPVEIFLVWMFVR